jgi:excisionase family DNA binding protein
LKDAHPPKEEAREEFLTARQLAAVLQVSETTVRRLAREGRIPSVRLTPRLVRFNLKAVCRALDGAPKPKVAPRPAAKDGRDDAQLSFAELLAPEN